MGFLLFDVGLLKYEFGADNYFLFLSIRENHIAPAVIERETRGRDDSETTRGIHSIRENGHAVVAASIGRRPRDPFARKWPRTEPALVSRP